ncbi:uracil-DNA glycosylase family protein [Aerococcaceae bacterium zg-ZUI334]|uniref:uracil-DNA glycosylase family protein n=1 Tax=Aerococcaceae TaxID=186827 RepID=UPI0013BAA0F8|nr:MULTISPECIES: uracil-DNA glycosylase family protein [unclassified Facklamia]MBR7927265.1 uracil-DNA glycosylase family protein [Aerococcaceae bacterium zg-ZUI334]NEW63681.1 uracil-DNA glycosylase family protein [Facklamia sp. 252]NEW67152.1 uracil-DNA glycosylase family protein [Facklamia sp. 253]QQD66307.1 uracil-DNA glycosylase family protein [Aerococcaceae bacterium zg-252]
MTNSVEAIIQAIQMDEQNQYYTEKGDIPLFSMPESAQILIIGQAPGIKAMERRRFWDDLSGQRLRKWLGVSDEIFYESQQFAILPLDFYYPGKGKSGDLPPRKGFAEKWHPKLLPLCPDIKLTLLVGSYAQNFYLEEEAKPNLTETVRHYEDYLPKYFPLVHPSPRNAIWQKKNPWFDAEVVPVLQALVAEIIKTE